MLTIRVIAYHGDEEEGGSNMGWRAAMAGAFAIAQGTCIRGIALRNQFALDRENGFNQEAAELLAADIKRAVTAMETAAQDGDIDADENGTRNTELTTEAMRRMRSEVDIVRDPRTGDVVMDIELMFTPEGYDGNLYSEEIEIVLGRVVRKFV